MELLKEILPIILYILLAILLVVLIIFVIRTMKTLNKVDKVVDEVNDKVSRTESIFDFVDKTTDVIAGVSDRLINSLATGIIGFFKRKKNKEEDIDE